VQPEVKANFEKSVEVLSNFCEVQHDVEFPDYPYTPMLWIILGSEGASAYRELVDSGKMRELQNQGDRMGGYVGSMISAVDYLQAQRVRKKARLAIDEQLRKYDALIAPSAGASSRKISESFNRPANSPGSGSRGGFAQGPALIPAGNIAGVPGLTIPNGLGQNNIPTGIQFLSGAWAEKTMLSLADAYQQETDWHKQRPSMTGLVA